MSKAPRTPGLRLSPRQQRFQRRCALGSAPKLVELGSRAQRLDRLWPECAPCRSRASGAFGLPGEPPVVVGAGLPSGWAGPPTWPASWARPSRDPSVWVGLESLPSGWTRAGPITPPNPIPDTNPLERAGGARFAINTPKYGHSDELGQIGYGTDTEITRDLVALNARVARHPGMMQLFYRDLVGDEPLPRSAAAIGALLDDTGVLAAKLDRILAFVQDLADMGSELKLIITLLTLGGQDGAPDYDIPPGRSNPIRFQWSRDHIGQTIIDAAGTEQSFDTSYGTEEWDVSTLDPSSAYKRTYMAILTDEVAIRFQARVESFESETGLTVADYIEGFEVCNEIETKHLVPESSFEPGGAGSHTPGTTPTPGGLASKSDAEGWGRLYAVMADAFLDQVPWARLLLPGLQTFSDTADAWASWPAKVDFVNGALAAIRDELHRIGSGYTLADVVSGIDLHYYHRGRTQVRSLAYLYADVSELRAVLDDRSLEQACVSVNETGLNVVCDTTSGDEVVTADGAAYDAACEDRDPDADWAYPELSDSVPAAHLRPWKNLCSERLGHLFSRTLATRMGANDFQGASTWMRMAVALAAGAPIVGWHSHMGIPGAGSDFAGQGLRRDLHDVDEADSDPATALQRPSWYAFQRMARLLTGATRAERLLPTLPSGHEMLQDREPLPHDDKVWVLEFRDLPSLPFAFVYLLFIDSFGTVPVSASFTGDSDDSPGCARVAFSLSSSSAFAWLADCGPQAAALVPGSPGEFPDTIWTAPPFEPLAIDTSTGSPRLVVELMRDRWPLLLFSSSPLRIDTVETS